LRKVAKINDLTTAEILIEIASSIIYKLLKLHDIYTTIINIIITTIRHTVRPPPAVSQ